MSCLIDNKFLAGWHWNLAFNKSCNIRRRMYVKTDSHIILKRTLLFPAQTSHFLGAMENTIFADLTKKSKYFKSNFFFTIVKSVLATERTKSRNRFVFKSVDFGRFMTQEDTETLILAFTSKTGQ